MIELAWPAKELWSNYRSRTHQGRTRATKAARLNAAWATVAAQIAAPPGEILVIVDLYPPNNRTDRTNREAACKALLDGVADGLKVNDCRFKVIWNHHAPAKPGKVVVTIGGQG